MSARSECLRLLTVAAIPAAIFAAFPYSALKLPSPSADVERQPFAAFISLDEKEESAALRRAKSALRSDGGAVSRLRADLSFGELPEEPAIPALGIGSRTRQPSAPVPAYEPTVFLPGQAALASKPLAGEPSAPPPPAFSREEMLKIDKGKQQ